MWLFFGRFDDTPRLLRIPTDIGGLWPALGRDRGGELEAIREQEILP